ncbi:MAG TPA: sulfatase-like hydrolase/transferase [Candidatus Ozemobacteraceae bacterium]|nr:sulfatase-like hydrolase/transferase [Candidatus Ozemobacteraceae bacterium]
MAILFFQHVTALLMLLELLRNMFPAVFWPLDALSVASRPIIWMPLLAVLSCTSLPETRRGLVLAGCAAVGIIQTFAAPVLPLWMLSVLLSVVTASFVIQSAASAWRPVLWRPLRALNALFLLLLYVELVYNSVSRSHLSFGHLTYYLKSLSEESGDPFGIKAIGISPAFLLPVAINIALYFFTSFCIVRFRPAPPQPSRSGLPVTIAVLILPLLFWSLAFQHIVGQRPFHEYLACRLENSAFPMPLPRRFDTPGFREAAFSAEQVDATRTSAQGSFAWKEPPRLNLVIFMIESWRPDALTEMPLLMARVHTGLWLKNHVSASNDTIGGNIGFHYGVHPIDAYTLKWDRSVPSSWIEFLRAGGYVSRKIGNFGSYLPNERYRFTPVEVYCREEGLPAPADLSVCGVASQVCYLLLRELEKPGLHFLETQMYPTHFNYYYPPGHEKYRPVVPLEADFIRNGFTAEIAAGLVNRYKNSCFFLDSLLDNFFQRLEAKGLDRNTVVVLAGDHGECLGEDDTLYHANGPHENQARTNLIILAPGLGPRVVEAPTSHVDFIPTLAPILGYTASGTVGRNILADATARNGMVTIDMSSGVRLAMRRRDHMTLFRLTSDRRLEWLITARNDNTIDDAIYDLYRPERLDELAALIREDRQAVLRLLAGK